MLSWGDSDTLHYHAQAGRPFFLGCYINARTRTPLWTSAAPSTPSATTRPWLSPSPLCTAQGSTTSGARASTRSPRAAPGLYSSHPSPPTITTCGRPSSRRAPSPLPPTPTISCNDWCAGRPSHGRSCAPTAAAQVFHSAFNRRLCPHRSLAHRRPRLRHRLVHHRRSKFKKLLLLPPLGMP